MPKKTRAATIRLDVKIYKQIEEIAASEDRSVAAQIERMLKLQLEPKAAA